MKALYDFVSFFDLIPLESKLLLVASLISLLFATFLFINRRRGILLLLFLSAFFLASSFALIDPFIHTWDESFHALVAKNTSNGYLSPHLFNEELLNSNSQNWVGNYIWLHKPPLSLWQMGFYIDLFGQNVYALRFSSVLLFSLTTLFVYDITRLNFSRSIAFYSAVLFILFQFSLEQVAGIHTSDHVDVAFTFYITASLWSWFKYTSTDKRKYLYLIGVFSGLAILTKWLVGLLIFGSWGVLIIVLLINSSRKALPHIKNLVIAFIIAIVVAAPWNIFAAINYPVEYWYELNYASRHFFEVIEEHGGSVWFYWDNLSTLFGKGTLTPVIILISVLSLFFTLKDFQNRVLMLSFILIPYLFFTLAATKMSNFVNIVSPVIIIAVVAMFYALFNRIRSRLKINIYFSLLVVPILFVFLIRPKQTTKNHMFEQDTNRTYYINAQKFIKNIDGDSADMFIYDGFNNYEYIIHMFYHQSVAFQGVLKEREISSFKGEGKKIKVIYKSKPSSPESYPEGTEFIKMK